MLDKFHRVKICKDIGQLSLKPLHLDECHGSKAPDNQHSFESYYLLFGSKLNGNNRWVRLAEMIP